MDVTVEPKTTSPPELCAGEDCFCQDSRYLLSPFKLARHCWLPSRSIFGKRTRASINRTSHPHSKGFFGGFWFWGVPIRSVERERERERWLNSSQQFIAPAKSRPSPGCSSLYCSSSSAQEAIHHTTHWSRVLHHNGGPNQYKPCVSCVVLSIA